MKLINVPRQMGKTTYLVKMFKKNKNSVILVPTDRQRKNMISNFKLNKSDEKRVYLFKDIFIEDLEIK